jgi:hypothetical protein
LFSGIVGKQISHSDVRTLAPLRMLLTKDNLLIWFLIVNSTVMCKTDEGYWCNFSMSTRASRIVEEYLAKDPMLADF